MIGCVQIVKELPELEEPLGTLQLKPFVSVSERLVAQ